MEIENLNPSVYKKLEHRKTSHFDEDEEFEEPFDTREIFGNLPSGCLPLTPLTPNPPLLADLIRVINDPEHPLTLEELHVVEENLIALDNATNEIKINFTPTIPHCSMATLIGLSIRVKLLRALPPRFKVTVEITPGTHASELAVNKQLADKERVAAALENKHLIEVINQCIATSQ